MEGICIGSLLSSNPIVLVVRGSSVGLLLPGNLAVMVVSVLGFHFPCLYVCLSVMFYSPYTGMVEEGKREEEWSHAALAFLISIFNGSLHWRIVLRNGDIFIYLFNSSLKLEN